jgi:hypothetical protein
MKLYTDNGVGYIEIKCVYGTYTAVVDLEDLERIRQLGLSWSILRDDRQDTVYVRTMINGKMKLLHRWILDTPDGIKIDHIDRDGLNNRKLNLRHATHSQNRQNMGAYKCNKTGIRGVTFHKATGKYQVHIQVDRIPEYLGLFDTVEEAAIVAKEARARMMPYATD